MAGRAQLRKLWEPEPRCLDCSRPARPDSALIPMFRLPGSIQRDRGYYTARIPCSPHNLVFGLLFYGSFQATDAGRSPSKDSGSELRDGLVYEAASPGGAGPTTGLLCSTLRSRIVRKVSLDVGSWCGRFNPDPVAEWSQSQEVGQPFSVSRTSSSGR